MRDDPAYLRDQAARCRRLAGQLLDRDCSDRLTELAKDYERDAAALAFASAARPTINA